MAKQVSRTEMNRRFDALEAIAKQHGLTAPDEQVDKFDYFEGGKIKEVENKKEGTTKEVIAYLKIESNSEDLLKAVRDHYAGLIKASQELGSKTSRKNRDPFEVVAEVA